MAPVLIAGPELAHADGTSSKRPCSDSDLSMVGFELQVSESYCSNILPNGPRQNKRRRRLLSRTNTHNTALYLQESVRQAGRCASSELNLQEGHYF